MVIWRAGGPSNCIVGESGSVLLGTGVATAIMYLPGFPVSSGCFADNWSCGMLTLMVKLGVSAVSLRALGRLPYGT